MQPSEDWKERGGFQPVSHRMIEFSFTPNALPERPVGIE